MADCWIDSNIFINAKNTAYAFDLVPGFWDFLDTEAITGTVRSSAMVYQELVEEADDQLADWIRASSGSSIATCMSCCEHLARRSSSAIHE